METPITAPEATPGTRTLDQGERLHRLTRLQVQQQRSAVVHQGEALQHKHQAQPLRQGGGLRGAPELPTCAASRMEAFPAPEAAGRRKVPPAV